MKKITPVNELEKDLLVSGRFILCEKNTYLSCTSNM